MAEPKSLARGANVALPKSEITASVQWQAGEKAAVYACLIGRDGHVRTAGDINPGYPRLPKGAGAIGAAGPQRVSYEIDVGAMPDDVAKIVFCVVAGDPARARCGALGVRLEVAAGAAGIATFELPADLRLEAAAILGELYRRNQDWKFRAVGQGFTEGLEPLSRFIGCTPHDLRTAYLPANGTAPSATVPPPKPKPAQSPPPPPPPPPPSARQPPPATRPAPRKREPTAEPAPLPAAGAEEASAFTSGQWALTTTGVQPLPGAALPKGALIQRELLDVRPDAAGLFWPSQFRHNPQTGEKLPPAPRFQRTGGRALGPAGLPELDEVVGIDEKSCSDEAVPDGARFFAGGGTPPRLVAIDPAEGQGWWKAPWSDRWIALGRIPRAAPLPAYASGLTGTDAGIFYAGESALVHLLPDQQPTFRQLPLSAEPVGPPCLVGGCVVLPIATASGMLVAIRSKDGSLRELPVKGASATQAPLGAPVVNRDTGICFWIGATGFLVFEEGLEGATCKWQAWPVGVAGLPFLPPYRAANGRFWAMCVEVGPSGGHGRALACGMAASGSREKHPLLGPHASAGGTTFRGRSRHVEPWREAVEEINLGFDYEGRWLLPLIRLGDRQTVVALATDAGSSREFLFREKPGMPREVTIALHTDNGPLTMLGQTAHIASTDDLELFLDGERLCIHHHESNQCASWSISFSR